MRSRARVRRAASLGGGLAAVGLGVLLAWGGLSVPAAVADDSSGGGGIGISVDIPTPTPTPSEDGAAAPADGGSPGGDTSAGSGDNGDSGVTPGGSLPADVATPGSTPAAVDPAMANGPLNVSGLSTRFVPSLNPGAGSVVATLTVHNGSTETIQSTMRVWLTGPVGNQLASSGVVTLKPLKAGATVEVSTEVTGVGQWTFVTAHARYTPPATIDGQTLKPVDRDAMVFAFPWANAVAAMLVATGVGIFVVVRLPVAAAVAVAA